MTRSALESKDGFDFLFCTGKTVAQVLSASIIFTGHMILTL